MEIKYPDLSKEPVLSVDIETYDPELGAKDAGVYRQDGNIVGVAIATKSGFSEYYNIGHPGISSELKQKNKKYIEDVLSNDIPKLTANGIYDYDWLSNSKGWNIPLVNKMHDVLVAEPLIDETCITYSLDSIALKYIGRKKYKNETDEYCKTHGLKGDSRKHLWQMPWELVRKYAIEDVKLPLEIFEQQWKIMKAEDLLGIYDIEIGLAPMLLYMRKLGARLDNTKVQAGTIKLHTALQQMEKHIKDSYGEFNYRSNKQLAEVMDSMGLYYNRNAPTEKMRAKGITIGNPHLDAKQLKKLNYPITNDILKAKQVYTVLNNFFLNSFTYSQVNGRLHCEFPRLKGDGFGTISGRFSSRHPNLQQIPGKDDDFELPSGEIINFMNLCRDCFIPEEGHILGKTDLSQIEYRFITHYARGPKSDEARYRYNNDPSTDFHQMVVDWTGVSRKDAKRLDFGASYAMGVDTCMESFGWAREQAEGFLKLYHSTVPFVSETRRHVANVAKRRGYITTILNRRARLTDFDRDNRKEYKYFNRLIQGSAADHLKKAMRDCWKAGLYGEDLLKPHLTVHDELVDSIPKTQIGKEAYAEQKRIMEECIKLRVPVRADAEIGTSWGQVKEFNDENWKELCNG